MLYLVYIFKWISVVSINKQDFRLLPVYNCEKNLPMISRHFACLFSQKYILEKFEHCTLVPEFMGDHRRPFNLYPEN